MKLQGFDRVANVYDVLASVVFGRSICHVQTYFLKNIKPGSKVIIVGGGTGWILQHIPEACEIWYVELSSIMLDQSRGRKTNHKIHFIHGTIEEVVEMQANVVVTNFFLDIFDGAALPAEIEKITRILHPDATWLVSDFVSERRWHRMLLMVMYTFFRYTTGLRTRVLPPWEMLLEKSGWKMQEEKYFCRGFMKTKMLRR